MQIISQVESPQSVVRSSEATLGGATVVIHVDDFRIPGIWGRCRTSPGTGL
jgi:hypothetical protein